MLKKMIKKADFKQVLRFALNWASKILAPSQTSHKGLMLKKIIKKPILNKCSGSP